MLKKSYSKTGKRCRVTFKVPEAEAERIAVLGEFNAWDAGSHPLVRRKDGSFSTTISLEAGREYRFRYLVDGDEWRNDDAADALVPNRFGTQDCVLAL
ncbi:MAG: isoamylase early set domain-containing protein [Acidobacteriota bacterium]